MNKKNLTQPEVASYSSPTCKIVCVRTESVCQTGSPTENGGISGFDRGDVDDDSDNWN